MERYIPSLVIVASDLSVIGLVFLVTINVNVVNVLAGKIAFSNGPNVGVLPATAAFNVGVIDIYYKLITVIEGIVIVTIGIFDYG